MADLVVRIREGKAISPRASERIYRNLIRIYWDSKALSQIPPYIQAASKHGSVDQAKSEVVLVNAPHGDYVFCVITKNQADQRWTSQNEGDVLIRNVSRLLWQYFEPNSTWKPAKGMADDYAFTVIELRLDPAMIGEGKTSLTGKVSIDGAANTIALEDYAVLPVTLKNVRPARP